MSDAMNLDEIRAYWQQQARRHGTSPEASWSDVRARDLEVAALLSRVQDGQRVLDVGCSNGWSTIRLAQARDVQIRGIDYLPEWIESAKRALEAARSSLRGTVEFAEGDALDLREPAGSYDCVITLRVLINLRTPELQARALRSCAERVRPGGLLLLSEATRQGLERLNALRLELGLDPLAAPAFNEYLDEDHVAECLAPTCELDAIEHFASTYFVGTRVLKPLLARLLPGTIDVANPDSELNRLCASLPAWGDYSTQRLLVFRRRE